MRTGNEISTFLTDLQQGGNGVLKGQGKTLAGFGWFLGGQGSLTRTLDIISVIKAAKRRQLLQMGVVLCRNLSIEWAQRARPRSGCPQPWAVEGKPRCFIPVLTLLFG